VKITDNDERNTDPKQTETETKQVSSKTTIKDRNEQIRKMLYDRIGLGSDESSYLRNQGLVSPISIIKAY
jgi:hypothetical protein